MCLTIKKEGKYHEWLKEDLTVYKLSLYKDKGNDCYELVSIIREYPYIEGVTQPTVEIKEDYGSVMEGYHAYLSIDDCYDGDVREQDIICKFVVPKGSEVYYGIYNDIVANKIKYIKPLKQIKNIDEERTIPDEFTPFNTYKA